MHILLSQNISHLRLLKKERASSFFLIRNLGESGGARTLVYPLGRSEGSQAQKKLQWSISVVSREGLEPSTPGLKGPCSNQLSYRPKGSILLYTINFVFSTQKLKKNPLNQNSAKLPSSATSNSLLYLFVTFFHIFCNFINFRAERKNIN